MKIFGCSDIHGRYELLKELVDTHLDFENNDILILLGDYVDGDRDSNSYLTLSYIYTLQQTYPNQVIALMGNHDYWLAHFIFPEMKKLDTMITPDSCTILDFLTKEEYENINLEAKRNSSNLVEFTNEVVRKQREVLKNKHLELFEWLRCLPMYYETKNQIFVHSGIYALEGCFDIWKEISDENDYLMKFHDYFYDFNKMIISGHVSTSYVSENSSFHRIYRHKNHIYLDATVQESKRLNLLKYCPTSDTYFEIYKDENKKWVETILEETKEGKIDG